MTRSPAGTGLDEPAPSTASERRLGIFGGTFNPIHFGHLRPALEVSRMFNMERIFLIPAAIPPHKNSVDICAPGRRLAMVRAAVQGNRTFAVSDMELKRQGPSYTIDTVREFIQTIGAGAQNFLILGMDAFFDIKTWMHYKELLSTISFIVMGRPEHSNKAAETVLGRMEALLKESTGHHYTQDSRAHRLTHDTMPAVYYAEVTCMDISSTLIRKLIRQGESIEYLVPETVRRFILKKGLYS
jgi:nicotinate-nucleotide adenylyltransferase